MLLGSLYLMMLLMLNENHKFVILVHLGLLCLMMISLEMRPDIEWLLST